MKWFRTIGGNPVARSYLVRLFGMALSLAIGVALARLLGPSGYGVYGGALSIAAVVLTLAQAGIPQVITRDVSASEATESAIGFGGSLGPLFRYLLERSLAVTAISLCVTLAAAVISLPVAQGATMAAILTVPLLVICNAQMAFMRGIQRVVEADIMETILRPLIVVVGLCIAALVSPRLTPTVALLYNFAAIAALCVLLFSRLGVSLRTLLLSTKASANNRVRRLPPSAHSMMVAEFWRTIEGHYPILILGWIGTSADTGFLRVALSVAVLVGLTSTVVNTVLMPRISALWAKRELIDLQTLLTRAAVMSISVTTVAAFAVVVLGRDLLRIAFGAEYEAAWVPLFVVAISYVVNSSSGAVVTLLNMTGHERVVLFAYAGSACVGAGLAIAFQASFGAIGVPIAMVLAELVKCIGLCLVAAKRLGLRASAVSGLHPRMP